MPSVSRCATCSKPLEELLKPDTARVRTDKAKGGDRSSGDLAFWLALHFLKDIGPVTARSLLALYHDPAKIFGASFDDLRNIGFVGELKARRIKAFDDWAAVDHEIKTVEEHGIRIIRCVDGDYPELLRHIDDAPLLLYVKGTLKETDRHAIAMVGSRKMSGYGAKVAWLLSTELATCGLTIVSGMAVGIDTVSHRGALSTGGRTIAVLGCGLDQPYPPQNKELFDALAEKGCVVSEFPLGTPPLREHFPRRNRLISGLSLGVIVVEAAAQSGSLITAGCALEQGREVFAVPGNITSSSSKGTNGLIRKGAVVVRSVEDVLEELSPHLGGMPGITSREKAHPGRDASLEISADEKAICNVLGDEPKHVDIVARETQIPAARLLGMLLNLEIKGIVKQAEGKRFFLA